MRVSLASYRVRYPLGASSLGVMVNPAAFVVAVVLCFGSVAEATREKHLRLKQHIVVQHELTSASADTHSNPHDQQQGSLHDLLFKFVPIHHK